MNVRSTSGGATLFGSYLVTTLVLVTWPGLVSANTYRVTSEADTLSTETLRWAITQANLNPGLDLIQVNFSPAITLTSPLPSITDSVEIRGDNILISGGDAYRVLEVAAGSVTLTEMRITHGKAVGAQGQNGTNGGDGAGAGLYVRNGTIILRDVVFEDNHVIGGTGGSSNSAAGGHGGDGIGGAIYVESGSVSAFSCTFYRNTAVGGAGGEGVPAGENGQGKGGAIGIADGATLTYEDLSFGATDYENAASHDANNPFDNANIFGIATVPSPRVSSVHRMNGQETGRSMVRYRVLFDAFMTGFDAGDCSLVYSEDSPLLKRAPVVAGVTGSGFEFEVSIDSGEMNGTFWMKVNDDDTIVYDGAIQSPLGGLGPDNGDFDAHQYDNIYFVDTLAVRLTEMAVISHNEIEISLLDLNSNISPANFHISGSGRGTLTEHPDTVTSLGDERHILSWKSGQMVKGGDITIVATDMVDWYGNAIRPEWSTLTHVEGGNDPTPPKLQLTIENTAPEGQVGGTIDFLVHLENIGTDFAEDMQVEFEIPENAAFVSLNVDKKNSRPIRDVELMGNTAIARFGAMDPADYLILTLKLELLAPGSMTLVSTAKSISILENASATSDELIVVEATEGDGAGNSRAEVTSDPTSLCGATGAAGTLMAAFLLVGIVRPRRLFTIPQRPHD